MSPTVATKNSGGLRHCVVKEMRNLAMVKNLSPILFISGMLAHVPEVRIGM